MTSVKTGSERSKREKFQLFSGGFVTTPFLKKGIQSGVARPGGSTLITSSSTYQQSIA
jgi:hypothetical protein